VCGRWVGSSRGLTGAEEQELRLGAEDEHDTQSDAVVQLPALHADCDQEAADKEKHGGCKEEEG
jgi:hypothetical protein